MTTHVLIVDSTTFKLHLENLFVGTGARDARIDFNNSLNSSLSPQAENNLVSMIADGFRIRRGDNITFYLQQNMGRGIAEGKFFGIFRATDDWVFLDHNDGQQYLIDELEKSLTFRSLIEPRTVYAEGVTEWEALDEIKNIACPNQMLWSLIYRKLKGNRGNTMITIYEADRLAQLIRNKNQKRELSVNGKALSFDLDTQTIFASDAIEPKEYTGRQEPINILTRLIGKYQRGQSFESHLQAYIVRNLGKGLNVSIDQTVLNGAEVEWLGNEVSCGVGMQRIDVMASVVRKEQKEIIPIELKSAAAEERNLTQIQRYVDWIEQYYIPNRLSDIQPVLITKRTDNKASAGFQRFTRAVAIFNEANKSRTYPLKYIEFYVDDGDLRFEEYPL